MIMSLSEVIKMTRQKAFMTQEVFAKEMGVTVITINRWETGKCKPNLTAMKKLKLFCELNNLPFEDIEKAWFNTESKE